MITTTVVCVEWCHTQYPTKKFVADAIHVRLVPYSTHDYPYLHPKSIRICIRFQIKKYKNKYDFGDIHPYSVRLYPKHMDVWQYRNTLKEETIGNSLSSHFNDTSYSCTCITTVIVARASLRFLEIMV
jgi:hypothetical protein